MSSPAHPAGAPTAAGTRRLDGRVVCVTGASRGIGRAIARAVAREGARVAVLARDLERLENLAGELREAGGEAAALRCDVRHEDQVARAVEETVARFGRVDALINNAGIGRRGRIDEITVEQWDDAFAVNLRGVFLMTRAVVPHMKRQGGGHIVNLSSVAGLVGNPGLSAYNATKFGLMGFSEALMLELRHDKIKVTAICPGSTDSDFGGATQGAPGREGFLSVDDVAHAVVEVLATAGNALISQVHLRPLIPPKRG